MKQTENAETNNFIQQKYGEPPYKPRIILMHVIWQIWQQRREEIESLCRADIATV